MINSNPQKIKFVNWETFNCYILPAPAKHLCWPVPSERHALRNAVQEKKNTF